MDHLPAEIILHILSFLPVADIMRVSQVNKRISELAGDQQLLRQLDLRQAYTCSQEDLKAFLRPRGRCHLVHRLDMDAVYWFRPPFDTISRMKNLNSLHLRGISLTFRQLHGLLTAKLPLQELSIDWPKCSEQPMKMIKEMQEGQSHLKFLCLTVQAINNVVDQFLKQCQVPLRLVLYCLKLGQFFPVGQAIPSRSRHDFILTCMPRIRNNLCPMESLNWKNIGKDWSKKQDEQLSSLTQVNEIVCDNLDHDSAANFIATVYTTPNVKGLQILSVPKLPMDLHGICEAVPQLERLRLIVLNSEVEDRMGYVQFISTLHHLTHLSLSVHILSETCGTEETCVTSATPREVHTPKFKRPRLGISSSEEDAEAGVLNLIVNNCPLLTMLEIGVEDVPYNSQVDQPIYWHSLKNIKKLKRLTHLTLSSIPVTNGRFLCEIAVGCPRLEFLRLSNLGVSGKCCYLKELTDSVTHMTCLTHLRYRVHQPYMSPATALFTALKSCQRLQRLSITCLRDMLPLDLAALEHLIVALPSLIFVAVQSVSTPQVACAKLTRKLKNVSRPALAVCACKNNKPSVPFAHDDMIDLSSWLSGSHSQYFYHQDFPSRHCVLHMCDS